MKKRLLIAIPVLNESSSIEKVLEGVLKRCKIHSKKFEFIIGVFDDGSTDDISRIVKAYPVFLHRNPINQGLGLNFREIVNHAIDMNIDYLITIDGDDQFYSEDLDNFFSIIFSQEPDLILGSRFMTSLKKIKQIPKIKIFGNLLVSKIIRIISGIKISDSTCGFRAYSSKSLFKLNPTEKFSYTLESLVQLLNQDSKITETPVRVKYFLNRNSVISGSIINYGFKSIKILYRQLLTSALKRFAAALVFLVPIGGLLGLLFVVKSTQVGSFSGNLYLGFLSGFFIILGFIGIIIFIINLKLEYMLKYVENMNRQHYSKKSAKCHKCNYYLATKGEISVRG